VGRDHYGTSGRFAFYALERTAYLRAFELAPARIIPMINLVLEAEDGSVIEHRKLMPNSGNSFLGENFQEAYGLNGSYPIGIIKIPSNINSYGATWRIEPTFSTGDRETDVLIIGHKMTLDQEDLKRLKRVKVYYDDLGLPQINKSE